MDKLRVDDFRPPVGNLESLFGMLSTAVLAIATLVADPIVGIFLGLRRKYSL